MMRRSAVILGVVIVIAIIGFGYYLHVLPDPAAPTRLAASPTVTPNPSAGVITPAPSSTPVPFLTTESSVAKPGTTSEPTPKLIGVKAESRASEGFDRFTLTFDQSAAPGYTIRYITSPTQYGSAKPIQLPGPVNLEITVSPTLARAANGTSLVPRSATYNEFPQLKAYAISGEVDGKVGIVLGLGGRTGYRVLPASGNDRSALQIDVATP